MHTELLNHIGRYVTLNHDEQQAVINRFKPVNVKRKQFLLEPGKVCKGNYFVVKGCLRMYFINRKLTEQITHFGLENWWIADHDSLMNQSSSKYYLQAVETSELLMLSPADEAALFNEVPQMETYFRLMFQRAYVAFQRKLEFIYNMTDEVRYREFARLFPGFVQRVPQYMLASYLGFTPQFMSRLRAKKT